MPKLFWRTIDIMAQLYNDDWVQSNIDNGVYNIKKNKRYIRTFSDDNIDFKIVETDNGVNEVLYIKSSLEPNEWYYIGNECCLNVLKNPKKVDLNYIFFSDTTRTAKSYSIDLKKTIGGKDVILKLVKQWNFALIYATAVVLALENYTMEQSYVGAITENNDREYLKREIDSIKKIVESTQSENSSLPTFLIDKNIAQNISNKQELKILEDFYDGKVYINNRYYNIDIRTMTNATYTLQFNSGILQ